MASASNLIKASGDKIIIWKIGNGEILKIIDAHSGGIWSLVKLSNNILISCSNDKTIKVWRIEDGELLNTFEFNKDVYYFKILSKNFVRQGLPAKCKRVRFRKYSLICPNSRNLFR